MVTVRSGSALRETVTSTVSPSGTVWSAAPNITVTCGSSSSVMLTWPWLACPRSPRSAATCRRPAARSDLGRQKTSGVPRAGRSARTSRPRSHVFRGHRPRVSETVSTVSPSETVWSEHYRRGSSSSVMLTWPCGRPTLTPLSAEVTVWVTVASLVLRVVVRRLTVTVIWRVRKTSAGSAVTSVLPGGSLMVTTSATGWLSSSSRPRSHRPVPSPPGECSPCPGVPALTPLGRPCALIVVVHLRVR